MIRNFKIVKVDFRYCNFLRKYDNKVTYNAGSKELRPFVGILFNVEECEYFAPLSSPKNKHLLMKSNIDFIKISNGKLGVVNLNNMIPVTKFNYDLLDLNSIPKNENDRKRQELLKSQLLWLNKNRKRVKKNAENLYVRYKNDMLPKNIKK